MNNRPTYPRHEDDDWVDEVRIVTVPRWKESELSGDEWRFSVRIEAYRKGVLLATIGSNNIRDAAALLPSKLLYFGGTHMTNSWSEEPPRPTEFWDGFCAQPTCPNQATHEFKRKRVYCSEGEAHDHEWTNEHIRFCEKHLHRGDCGLNDADNNYEVVALRLLGTGEWKPLDVNG